MILDYLDAALGEGTPHYTSKGLQYSYKCPFCQDYKERLYINIDRKVYWCHNCESTGTIVTFISEYAHVTWKEALKIYREFEGYDHKLPESIEEEVYSRLIKAPEIEQPKYVYPLPEEFILIEEARGPVGEKAVRYLKSREVTLEMAERYYIGYCEEGKYANRIIMPDFENGELIYWQARTFLPTPTNPVLKKMFRKVLNPSLTQDQVKQGIRAVDKSEVIGNIDFVLEEGMAVLCEGKFDSYTIGDIGACLHGKHMSDEQFLKLVLNRDKIQCIAIMLDGDAMKNAIITADRLYKYFDDVLVCKLPKDADPNSLGRKKVLEILKDAIPYSPMFNVKARLKGWL